MRAAGVRTHIDCESTAATMGFAEVLRKASGLYAALSRLGSEMKKNKPNLLITIDFPDFNFRLIKKARKLAIPCLYFITPKVWAWREKRCSFLSEKLSACAVIFPFEEDFLRKRGVKNCYFVGHPLAESLPKIKQDRTKIRERLGIGQNQKLLAIFLGSRESEIKRHYPILKDSAERLTAKYPDLLIAAPLAKNNLTEKIKFPNQINLKDFSSIEILSAADAGLIKSGTSNLQAALLGTPFAMFYKVNQLTAVIARLLINRSDFSIVNILYPESAPEYVQENCTSAKLYDAAEKLLFNDVCRSQQLAKFAKITEILSQGVTGEFRHFKGVYQRVAELASRIINSAP